MHTPRKPISPIRNNGVVQVRRHPAVAAYLSERGRRAGAAGRGKAKRRSSAHYARIARLGVLARQQARAARLKPPGRPQTTRPTP